jgi:hypothetical protein
MKSKLYVKLNGERLFVILAPTQAQTLIGLDNKKADTINFVSAYLLND